MIDLNQIEKEQKLQRIQKKFSQTFMAISVLFCFSSFASLFELFLIQVFLQIPIVLSLSYMIVLFVKLRKSQNELLECLKETKKRLESDFKQFTQMSKNIDKTVLPLSDYLPFSKN